MRDTDLYQALLGLTPPWTVSRVELDIAGQRVDVWAGHARGSTFACSDADCRRDALAVYDHAEERAWRHLDSMQFQTFLHARPPRVKCPDHGVRQARLPWAEPKPRFTLLFEWLAIDVLLAAGVTGALRILRLSWDEAWHLLKRAVARGQRVKEIGALRKLGVDEKSFASGHDYVTIVCDLERGTVDGIEDGRRKESLNAYYDKLTLEQRASIEAVAMDMHGPFATATAEKIPDARAKIVHDKFHVMRDMAMAVDEVRRTENAELLRRRDDSLVKTKYMWLFSDENLPERSRARFEALRAADLKTAQAWAIKENLRAFWSCATVEAATAHWDNWFAWAVRSKLQPVVSVAKKLKRHITGLLSYFRHRITNAMSEGINSKIQTIKKMAYGYRNRDNFKTAIYFFCGGLKLKSGLATH
jgi:transposase